jgi:PilZ domain
MDEKRAFQRRGIWFPVTLETGSTEVWAVARDAGAGGILISSAGALQVGTAVTVTFRVGPDDPTERRLPGTVVRFEPHRNDGGGAWPHRVAIEFAEPLPELESLFESWEPTSNK